MNEGHIGRDVARTEQCDVAVIGGGIYGIALAFESARRGLRTVLVERDDFGGGTSRNWLRILHGGLRYLQTLDLHRFRESVAERSWFLRNFPDLVEPLACLMPLYGPGLRRPPTFRMAFMADAALGWRRNDGLAPSHRLPAGRVLDIQDTAPDASRRLIATACSAGHCGTMRSQPAGRVLSSSCCAGRVLPERWP